MSDWLYAPNLGPDDTPQFWAVMALYHQVEPGDGVFIYRDLGIEAYCSRRFDALDCHQCLGHEVGCLEHCFHVERFPTQLPRMALAASTGAWSQLTKLERMPTPASVPLDGETADWLLQLGLEEAELAPIELSSGFGETEVQRLRKERLTQGLFRDRLMAFWKGACAITQIQAPTFLRASHIKPWAVSNNRERMDPRNGLLLAVNYDFAFDAGLITFSDEGVLEAHPKVDLNHLHGIGVHLEARIQRPLDNQQMHYLAHHREHVFGKFAQPRASMSTHERPGTYA